MQKYMAVSCAKSLTLDLNCSVRSFMYAKNKMGLRTEPCTTSEVTGIITESQSPLASRMARCSQTHTEAAYSIKGRTYVLYDDFMCRVVGLDVVFNQF